MRSILLAGPLLALAFVPSSARYTVAVAGDKQAPPPIVGMGSCAARGCHGGLTTPGQPTTSPNAFSGWIARDPHAGAYAVLTNAASKRIMRNLTPLEETEVPAATDDVRCLACHSTPALALGDLNANRKLLEEGVGCEACHGGAKNWTGPHAAWSGPTDSPVPRRDKYRDHGMTWLNDTTDRAKACVGCHVGSIGTEPRQEVDHQLIAAGHPRLSFEYHSYMKLVPRHWAEVNRTNTGPPVPTGPPNALAEWRVGQEVCAGAALTLLKEQAKSGPWPELAQLDCFGCHHDLQPESWRQRLAAQPGRRLGEVPWNRWAWPLPVRVWSDTEGKYRELIASLSSREKATLAADALVKLIGTDFTPAKLTDAQLDRMSWDDAAQYYLALVAVHDATPAAIDHERMQEVRRWLELRNQKVRANSPATYRVGKDFPPPSRLFEGVWRK